MIKSDQTNKGYSQRQLRVGELVKQNIGEIFIKNETKISSFNSRIVTVTEVRMTRLENSQSLCDTTRWNRHEGNRWCID